jgi:CheY-like chemotaxis protein
MKTVLSVDPSRVVRAVIERHLERFDCELREATTADEALAAIAAAPPDVMLVDAGAHAVAVRRGDAGYDAVPVVLLTTDHPASADHEHDPNVVATLHKPFEQSGFDRAVRRVLGTPRGDRRGPARPRATVEVGGTR